MLRGYCVNSVVYAIYLPQFSIFGFSFGWVGMIVVVLFVVVFSGCGCGFILVVVA